MNTLPTDGYSITLRFRLANKPSVLDMVTSTIGAAGCSIGALDIVEAEYRHLTRDITTGNCKHVQPIVGTVNLLVAGPTLTEPTTATDEDTR